MVNGSQRILVILIALASLGVTLLLVMLAIGRGQHDLQGGVDSFDQRFVGPQFELVDHHGETFSSKDLAGKAYVVDFIFTRCGGVCPAMTQAMRDLQTQLKQRDDWAGIELISISVDPEYDTPEVLQAYINGFHLDDAQWTFLTGERETIWRLIRDGFHQSVGEDVKNTTMPIFHTPNFLLVDRAGVVRAWRQGIDQPESPDEMNLLLADIDRVMKETPGGE